MKSTFFKIRWAEIRCHLYLLFYGMWRGEYEFRAHSRDEKLTLVAAGSGLLSNASVKISRVFYNPKGISRAGIQDVLNGWEWTRRT